jgi:hypothetical protein
MEIELFKGIYQRNLVKHDKKTLYIFTDNWNRSSSKQPISNQSDYYKKYGKNSPLYYPSVTQAVIRGLNNAFPISTMFDQYRTQFNDNLFGEFKAILNTELEDIYRALHNYHKLIYCTNLGKGNISNMPLYAPNCYIHLKNEFESLLNHIKNV